LKNWRKKLAFLAQIKALYAEKMIVTLVFRTKAEYVMKFGENSRK
jgi:hypothetical protein